MKISNPSLKKLLWLINHPTFKQDPLRTLVQVVRWEIIRINGKPIPFIYDKSLNILLYPNDGVARLVFYFDYHEPVEFAFLNQYLNLEMVCVDVGANIGMYSLFMAKRTKYVISFEPQAEAMLRFEASCAGNQIVNINRVEKAVSNESKELALNFVYGDSAKTFTVSNYKSQENQNLVHAISLDIYFLESPISRLDYLKIDAEGAEPEILLGAKRTLTEYRPLVQIEIALGFQSRSEKTDFDFKDFFAQLNYTLCYIDVVSASLKIGNSWNTIAVPNEKIQTLQQTGLLTI